MTSCEKCKSEPVATGLCRRHYSEQYRRRIASQQCEELDCQRPQVARGLCRGHYLRKVTLSKKQGPVEKFPPGHSVAMSLRVKQSVYDVLKHDAKQYGMSVTSFVRQIISDRLGVR